jgi:hypothetical protein
MKHPKIKYCICVVLSFLCSAVPPAVAVFQKFPMWEKTVSPAYTIGVGAVLAAIVLLICFRKTIIPVVKEKLGIKSVPPVVIWVVGLVAVVIFEKINTFMTDIKVVIFAGLIGSAVGWCFSLASAYFDKKVKEGQMNGNDQKP